MHSIAVLGAATPAKRVGEYSTKADKAVANQFDQMLTWNVVKLCAKKVHIMMVIIGAQCTRCSLTDAL